MLASVFRIPKRAIISTHKPVKVAAENPVTVYTVKVTASELQIVYYVINRFFSNTWLSFICKETLNQTISQMNIL